jgi:Abortive infection C-terminus
LAFDLAKTVVESACRTILAERKIAFGFDDDLPRLFKSVTAHLPILPVAASAEIEARKSLAQTLNGLHTALQGVCELRNTYGFASHGTAGPRAPMESVQALLAAQAADAI